jgi:UDP-N-acetylmuramoyl-tripeptide--D-alanyl-D-alanine ligase
MEASLRNAAPRLDSKSTLYVAGDLFELGDYAAAAHQRMVDLMLELGISDAILVGPIFGACMHPYVSVASTEELMAVWTKSPPQAKTLWFKGSRGMALERLLSVLE